MAENNGYDFKAANGTGTKSDITGTENASGAFDPDTLRLKIVSRSGTVADIRCSSVQMNVADDQKGKGGGSFGVYPDCIKSVIQLCEGKVTAYNGEEMIFETEIGGGFATVDNNTVTVISDG